MTTPTTPPPSDAALDVAAVAAEARALLDAREVPCVHPSRPSALWRCGWCAGCVARIDAQTALRDASWTMTTAVVALAARVTAAEAAHAALAGAVRAVDEAHAAVDAADATLSDALHAAVRAKGRGATGAVRAAREALTAAGETLDAARKHLDALLRGAPGGFVRASVVAEYVAIDDIATVRAEWHSEAMRAQHDLARTAPDDALAAIEAHGVQSADDALAMADAILDPENEGVEWLMAHGCDVMDHLRVEVRRLAAALADSDARVASAVAENGAIFSAARGTLATPSDAAMVALHSAGGCWLVSYDDDNTGDPVTTIEYLDGARALAAKEGDNPVRWVAIDRCGRACIAAIAAPTGGAQ